MASQRLAELKEELTAIKSAKSALLTNGQSHSLTGSHAFTGISYKDLCNREGLITAEIVALNGGKSYTLPDFS
jgi:hypothetical protein